MDNTRRARPRAKARHGLDHQATTSNRLRLERVIDCLRWAEQELAYTANYDSKILDWANHDIDRAIARCRATIHTIQCEEK